MAWAPGVVVVLALFVIRAARLEPAVHVHSGRDRPNVSARPIAAIGDNLVPPEPAGDTRGRRAWNSRERMPLPLSYLHCGLKLASMSDVSLTTKCAIAGGGPAGMMLGFLLARAGVPVVVLEKHADFFRDSAETQCILQHSN